MRVKKTRPYEDQRPKDIAYAVNETLCADHNYNDGQFECMQNEITHLREVLERFLVMNIKTVDQLNALAGWERYEEAE